MRKQYKKLDFGPVQFEISFLTGGRCRSANYGMVNDKLENSNSATGTMILGRPTNHVRPPFLLSLNDDTPEGLQVLK